MVVAIASKAKWVKEPLFTSLKHFLSLILLHKSVSMKFKSDLEIAQENVMSHIKDVAAKLNIEEDHLEMYGKYKSKLPLDLIDDNKVAQSNLILVSAITPTPAGEGKTTTSIGLNEGLNRLKKKSVVVLIRQTDT